MLLQKALDTLARITHDFVATLISFILREWKTVNENVIALALIKTNIAKHQQTQALSGKRDLGTKINFPLN